MLQLLPILKGLEKILLKATFLLEKPGKHYLQSMWFCSNTNESIKTYDTPNNLYKENIYFFPQRESVGGGVLSVIGHDTEHIATG